MDGAAPGAELGREGLPHLDPPHEGDGRRDGLEGRWYGQSAIRQGKFVDDGLAVIADDVAVAGDVDVVSLCHGVSL
jgi:hypothetical protein